MYLIDQHTKKIMEECKLRARDAGLSFDDESLEYIVTNRDMLELSPKLMIPTLYDYWVNDVEVLKGIGKYKLYPSNPYETVINSRPAISFYNDNNPDWLNIMIFYHVLGHIDFFQNNIMFKHTWNDDFVGQALADKRLIANLRSEHGRWVDYIIEFARSIDNLAGYYDLVWQNNYMDKNAISSKLEYYFKVFLQEAEKVPDHEFYKEVGRFNNLPEGKTKESTFFAGVKKKHPEFEALYKKYTKSGKKPKTDVLEYIRDNSPFLSKQENQWMKSVINIVRNTSLYFSPQGRSKILNEGWASYWHDELFRLDDRITGHEIAYAKTNAFVTSINRVGLNPYAIGLRLIQYIEDMANKGKLEFDFQLIENIEERKGYNKNTGGGRDAVFSLRKDFSDFTLINTFIGQEFVDLHKLFVTGQRLNPQRGTVEYYVKSRKAEDYKQMILDSLYHPPDIVVDESKTGEDVLYLNHNFEGKQLYRPYVPETMIGIEYLWGCKVQLETTEIINPPKKEDGSRDGPVNKRVVYTMKNKKIDKHLL